MYWYNFFICEILFFAIFPILISRFYLMRYTYQSMISPEPASEILLTNPYRNPGHA